MTTPETYAESVFNTLDGWVEEQDWEHGGFKESVTALFKKAQEEARKEGQNTASDYYIACQKVDLGL